MNPKQKQLYIIIGVVIVAIVAVGAVIAISGRPTVVGVEYSALPNERGSDGAFILGNPEAPITIIEFADFACPHCQEYRPEIERFISDFVVTGRARFEFRLYPTAGGQQSVFVGQLAECIADAKPGGFWDAYPVLYEYGATGQYFSDNMGRLLTERVGLSSYSQLLSCSSDANQVHVDVAFGQAHGVSGTPAVLMRVNDGEAQWVTYGGTTYDRGGPPYSALKGIVDTYSPAS